MAEYRQTAVKKLMDVKRIVTVYYRELPKGYENLGESHDFWEILYVDRGQIALEVNGNRRFLRRGQLILYRPGEFHSNSGLPLESAAGLGIVSFVCPSPAMEELRESLYRPNAYERELLGDIIHRGKRSFRPVEKPGKGRGLTLRRDAPKQDLQVIQAKLELLLLSLWERGNACPVGPPPRNNQKNREDSLALQIEALLLEDLSRPLPLSQIGARLGVSVSTVKQVFAARFGHGVIHHRNLLRIREAKRLICEGGENFSQIADALGFSSVHYFSRLFRSLTGLSPTDYAKSIVYGENYE